MYNFKSKMINLTYKNMLEVDKVVEIPFDNACSAFTMSGSYTSTHIQLNNQSKQDGRDYSVKWINLKKN